MCAAAAAALQKDLGVTLACFSEVESRRFTDYFYDRAWLSSNLLIRADSFFTAYATAQQEISTVLVSALHSV